MAEESEFATVRVAQGALRGRRVQSKAGGAFFSFKGVPYARPPLGPLRFKDAQPPEPWEGVRDALREGANCTQLNLEIRDYMGEEDCLYLNVYTPQLPSEEASPLPVMFWIHGGGFASGSGDEDLYGPDYLLTENVVLVSINYRLGPLGFLLLGEAAPGNAGLKDQVAALRWVQENVAAFGGNPSNVTVFGESAGGSSVHFLMLSPLTKDLFHGAIVQSAAALNPWAVQTEPEETTRRLARALGCTSGDPAAIVEFLRGVDHLDLVRAANEHAPADKDRGRILKFSFVPTPENPAPGVELFLPAPVPQLIEEGRHHAVPYITGLTSEEAIFHLAFIDFREEEKAREVDSAWDKNVLPELRLPVDGSKSAAALDAIRDFYMDGKPLSKETLPGYINLFTDLAFGEGIDYTVRKMAKTAKAPLYLYCFTVDDTLNFVKLAWNLNEPGACHADDLGYLFSTNRIDTDVPAGSPAALARRRLLRLWGNFARTGNPTPTDDPLLGVRWEPYTEKDRTYLEIGSELRQGTDLYAERSAFWENFYKKYSS